jgi:hypothetical protein
MSESNITKNLLPDNLFSEDSSPNKNRKPTPQGSQSHVHEFLGSTRIAGPPNREHNHRFAGVTSEAVPLPGGDPYNSIKYDIIYCEILFKLDPWKLKIKNTVYSLI